MKKIKLLFSLLLLVMFIPVMVNAESSDTDKVFIDSISIEDKSNNVVEISKATASDKDVTINLSMSEVGDSIVYKMIIKNESSKNYELDKTSFNLKSDYLDYSLASDDDSNVVKANSSKIFHLTVKYRDEVSSDSYESGIYSDIQTMTICLSDDIINPNTGIGTYIFIIIISILLISGIVYIMLKKNKHVKLMMLIIGLTIMIPMGVFALCSAKIKIDFKVTISNEDLPSFYVCNSDNKYYYYEGMTFADWLKSDLYPGYVDGEYESLDECVAVWGDNKGCQLTETKTVYSYKDENNSYYYTLEQCQNYWKDGCTSMSNVYVSSRANYKYGGHYFSSLSECETEYGSNECINYYDYGFVKGYLSLCLDDISYCSLTNTVYNHIYTEYIDFDSRADCQENYGEGQCIERNISIYKPTLQDSTSDLYIYYRDVEGKLSFWTVVGGDEVFRDVAINQNISSRTYMCESISIAECVSPESDILSSDGVTIKAKNIKENDEIAYYDFETNKVEIGKVSKVYIHKNAIDFVKYTFEDGSYIEVTDYHPIYTIDGWKSYTNRNGYSKPVIGDLVMTNDGYKKLDQITPYNGNENFYDFKVVSRDGKTINNYYANGILVQGSY